MDVLHPKEGVNKEEETRSAESNMADPNNIELQTSQTSKPSSKSDQGDGVREKGQNRQTVWDCVHLENYRVGGEFRQKEIHVEETKHSSARNNIYTIIIMYLIIDLTKNLDIIELRHSQLRQ